MINRILVVIALAVSVGALSYAFYVSEKVEKVVVVDVIKVFNEFKMKKELEARAEKVLNQYAQEIDSLGVLLEQTEKNNDEKSSEIFEQLLYDKKVEVQQAYEVSNKNINEQVWKRLNPLIDEFSKEHNYRIVIGANGMGTVLYTDESAERTNDLIQFINKKYANGK